jgi:integrase
VNALIESYATFARAGGLAANTIADRCAAVDRCLRTVGDPLEVDRSDLVEWLADPGWKAWTRATYRQHITAFFAWLVEFGHRADNPAAALRRPRVPKGLPKPVTDAVLADAIARSDEPWRSIIMLAAYAGLRASEIAQLHARDVAEDVITIRRSKGGGSAQVPTHPRLWAHLAGVPDGPVVRDRAGRPVTGKWISAHARHHFDALGLPEVHIHRFRHWFGTTVQRGQGDIRVTQECMRHANVSSTMIYTEVASAAKVSAIGGLPWGA